MVFLLNILLLFLGYQAIKSNDKNSLATEQNSRTEVQSLSQEVIDTQNKITTDRENKLRGLNNTPKEIKQNQVTTQTTTKTTGSSSSAKTKTS